MKSDAVCAAAATNTNKFHIKRQMYNWANELFPVKASTHVNLVFSFALR